MKKAVIIGASSGIGKELAKVLSNENYIVGLAARRVELLEEIRSGLSNNAYIKVMDVSKCDDAMVKMRELIREMDGVDLVVISSGTGHINRELDWDKERETVDVNVSGFSAAVNVFLKHFIERGSGHLVGISSVAALRGGREAPAYNASKAFVSNYLEGIRCRIAKSGASIKVTDIRPGFVDTAMAQGEGLFWVATPERAARQIYQAIVKGKRSVYITGRWQIIACLLRNLPGWLYQRM